MSTVTERSFKYLDERLGTASLARTALRKVFPDHWSFLLGEIALFALVVLIFTGTFLTFFYTPSVQEVVYHGPYAPLQGAEVSAAYNSVLRLSFEVRAGLLMRQTHHWAADVFIAAIVLHMLRIFFTGAFRKPRDLTYYIGVTMLVLALLEGYLGYSLVDDLLSGMGLAIGYSVAMSILFFGANLAALIWGGPFPGKPEFWSRMYVTHVFLLPVLIGTLLTLHLFLVAARHHTQFRESRRTTEKKVVGIPAFPGYAPRSLALFCAVAAVLFLLGGLVQINPIWLWGPYHISQGTNGAQPDWYLGWLIGALRLVPHFDVTIGNYTLIPNPFWGGALFPLIVFAILYLTPSLERRFTGEYGFHHLLDRPRDAAWRTALGAALFAWVFVIFLAGASDRVFVSFGISYEAQIWVYRVLVFALPVAALVVTRRWCLALQESDRLHRRREGAEAEARGELPQPE